MNEEAVLQAIHENLQSNYGISGRLKRLPGENLNYLVTTPTGQRFVAKLVDEDMPSEVISLAAAAINHALSKKVRLELPEIVFNKYGNLETRIRIHKNTSIRLHLINFLEGNILYLVSDISIKLRESTGESLAEFDLALADFDHPAAHRSHRWNLAETGQHRDSIALIRKPEKRDLLIWAFDTWEQKAAARFHELPHQVIHGDAFAENILVRGEQVTGLVDFGDCCYNPTVCELAICLAYLMMDRDEPLQAAADVTRGYHRVRPLSGAEFDVLLPLVCARLAVTITVAAERQLIDPDNPNWFGCERLAWPLLRAVFSAGIEETSDHLKRLL